MKAHGTHTNLASCTPRYTRASINGASARQRYTRASINGAGARQSLGLSMEFHGATVHLLIELVWDTHRLGTGRPGR